jgi:ribosomal RNA assembly protein
MIESVVIPEERKAVLIGRDGRTRAAIEKKTGTRISVSDGIDIEGEPVKAYATARIVKAIGRGFTPKEAMLLLDEEYDFDIVSLRGETQKTIQRLMGRVIGRNGMTRKKIEEMTHTCICVYGKTVSIIGKPDCIATAREAVSALLSGAPHSVAYRIIGK